jgi:hypothetical protein
MSQQAISCDAAAVSQRILLLGAEHLNYYDVFFFYLCTVHFYNVKILLPTNAPFIYYIKY